MERVVALYIVLLRLHCIASSTLPSLLFYRASQPHCLDSLMKSQCVREIQSMYTYYDDTLIARHYRLLVSKECILK